MFFPAPVSSGRIDTSRWNGITIDAPQKTIHTLAHYSNVFSGVKERRIPVVLPFEFLASCVAGFKVSLSRTA
jgi:hypothetical protein